jgi:hypothetical protein
MQGRLCQVSPRFQISALPSQVRRAKSIIFAFQTSSSLVGRAAIHSGAHIISASSNFQYPFFSKGFCHVSGQRVYDTRAYQDGAQVWHSSYSSHSTCDPLLVINCDWSLLCRTDRHDCDGAILSQMPSWRDTVTNSINQFDCFICCGQTTWA